MSEVIKSGTMVWVRDKGYHWQDDTREYIGPRHDGGHATWATSSKGLVSTWDEVTAQNPNLPKAPDFVPEGMELWKRGVNADGIVDYTSDETGIVDENPQNRDVFHAFAVQAGYGNVGLVTTPNWFTRENSSILEAQCFDGCFNAKIIGAIMKKEVN